MVGVIIRGLEGFSQLGTIVVRSAHDGLKRVAEMIKQRLRVITPKWYGESITIEERSMGKVWVGPTVWVPEDDDDGSIVKKDVCAEFKFQFADVRHKAPEVRPYLRQVRDEMISSGQAKTMIVEEMVIQIRELFRW